MKNIIIRKYFSNTVMHVFLISIIFIYCQESNCQESIYSQETKSSSINSLQQHMESIASDVTEGRFTGTTGYRKAAEYAVSIFREAGLKPGWTNEKGEKSFLQPVPFIRKDYTSTSLIIRKIGREQTFHHSTGDFAILDTGIGDKDNRIASPAFIGYGISEPEMGWDDYAGLDLKGKWVIIIDGVPPVDSYPSFTNCLREKYADGETRDLIRYRALVKHKVAGLIILPDKKEIDNWSSTVLRSYRYNYIGYADDGLNREEIPVRIFPVILIGPEILKTLFSGQSFDPMTNEGKYHSYILDNTKLSATINCKKEVINCYNIIAIVPGTDSTLRNEYLTVGAHLDHLGKIDGHIYNGANDDASGCVIILEAAKNIALNPPKRSVLFILYTGEELNVLSGSKHFLRNPSIPINQILLNINIEQIGSKNRSYKGVWVMGTSKFEVPFQKMGDLYSKTDFKFDSIEECIDDLAGHVDLWSYYQKKIPVIMLSSGGFPEHHTHEDNIDLIDFDHLLVASDFLYSSIVELGNSQK